MSFKAFLVLVFLVLVVSCDGRNKDSVSDEKTTIRFSWWGGDSRNNAVLDAIHAYMEINPNVVIEPEYSGYTGYVSKLLTSMGAKKEPDVFQTDTSWFNGGKFSKNGKLIDGLFVDFQDYKDIIDLENFDKSILDAMVMVDGTMIGLPTGINGRVFLLAKDLYDKDPELFDSNLSLDALIQSSDKLLDGTGYQGLILQAIDQAHILFIREMIQLTGVELSLDGESINWDRNDLITVYTKLIDAMNAGIIPNGRVMSEYTAGGAGQYWEKGEFAGTVNYLSTVRSLKADSSIEDWVIKPALIDSDGKRTAWYVRAALIYSASPNSQNIEESLKFINAMFTNETMISKVGDALGYPASKKTLAVLSKNGLLLDSYIDIVQNHLIPNQDKLEQFPDSDQKLMRDISGVILENLLSLKITPEQAADEFTSQVTAYLQGMQ